MDKKFFKGKREIDGPRVMGDPIRYYFFRSLETPVHWHDDFEILYLKKGSVFYRIGQNNIYAKEGDILLVPPYVLHSGTSNGKFLEICVYVIPQNFLCPHDISEKIYGYFAPIVSGEMTFPSVISENMYGYDIFASSLDKVSTLENQKPDFFELDIFCEFIKFYENLYKYNYIHPQKSALLKSDNAMKHTISYIEENYFTQMSVEEIAKECGFSKSHFMGLFKKYTGESCIAYINNLRVNKAIKLLKYSDLSIISISEQVGFSSVSYFNRTIKKITGKTPRQIQKET
ncbi:MAG: AraC family transcriptional regulator [Acutalibacteraceae bacterium]